MKSCSLQALVNDLPALTGERPQKKPKGARALSFIDATPDGFVWPDLREAQFPEGSRVVLIEAPGALGKSMAASATAATTGWPIVDTSAAQVGSYSLSGLIQDAFGISSTYLASLAEGAAGVVIDALDEAHLKAGTRNFEAFLDDLSRIAEESPGPTSFVLFSRPDTASLIKLHFDVSGHPLSRATLD